MNRSVFHDVMREARFISSDSNGNEQYGFLDNATIHTVTTELQNTLHTMNTSLRVLPPNTTHKVHLLDKGIFKLFKQVCMELWEHDKNDLIQDGEWVAGRLLRNLGK